MGSSEDETKPGSSVEWDENMEIQLFYAMADHKPVGINRHFQMVCIWHKLSNSITKEISTQDIWKHLETLYDISMLNETERIPFPNDEVPFSLPEDEFGAHMKQKYESILQTEENDASGSKDTSLTALTTKVRKESGSSYASTDTPSIKSDRDYDKRRDSRDSNASGPRDGSAKKSISRDKTTPKSSSLADEDAVSRRGRRRTNTSTPAAVPAKRRRT